MIRTLSIVAVMTLVAGLAMGFFVAEAAMNAKAPPAAPDPRLEQRVAQYQAAYGLSADETSRIREALREHDQGLLDLYRRLHLEHSKEFGALKARADLTIQAVLAPHAPKAPAASEEGTGK